MLSSRWQKSTPSWLRPQSKTDSISVWGRILVYTATVVFYRSCDIHQTFFIPDTSPAEFGVYENIRFLRGFPYTPDLGRKSKFSIDSCLDMVSFSPWSGSLPSPFPPPCPRLSHPPRPLPIPFGPCEYVETDSMSTLRCSILFGVSGLAKQGGLLPERFEYARCMAIASFSRVALPQLHIRLYNSKILTYMEREKSQTISHQWGEKSCINSR